MSKFIWAINHPQDFMLADFLTVKVVQSSQMEPTAESLIETHRGYKRFGLNGRISVDSRGWAAAADRLGFPWFWALEWIDAGWPVPPAWTWFGIHREGAD